MGACFSKGKNKRNSQPVVTTSPIQLHTIAPESLENKPVANEEITTTNVVPVEQVITTQTTVTAPVEVAPPVAVVEKVKTVEVIPEVVPPVVEAPVVVEQKVNQVESTSQQEHAVPAVHKLVKVLVLFYSTYGHLYASAEEIAKGVRMVDGAEVHIRQVKETLSDEVIAKVGATETKKMFEHIPFVTPAEISEYDAIFFGTPGKYGNMAYQLKELFDSMGQLWATNALVGKVGAVFGSTASQHGGNEAVLINSRIALLHFGMIVVGLPYSSKEQMELSEVLGGTPYGVTTIAGGDGSRQISEKEKTQMQFYGKHVTEVAQKLRS
ncbi:NAD(P)H dehydrogenase (quinone) [Acrasis kona]|uniref:NAD(P)H dehydrogenase (Quinone) n=1 Tax=Acrasis kona TaxID=1008807 RepID=A0AAW2YZZ0_9EUKA